MKKILIFLGVFSVLNAEPSVFSAGNLDLDNPYGLTSDEKHILKNKKDIQKLNEKLNHIITIQNKLIKIEKRKSKEIKSLRKKITSIENNIQKINLQIADSKVKIGFLRQDVDGIKTIIHSYDSTKHNIKSLEVNLYKTMKELNKTKIEINTEFKTINEKLTSLNNDLSQTKKVSKQNIQTMISLIEKLAQNLDKIKKETEDLNIQTKYIKSNLDFKVLPKQDIYNKALNLFKKRDYQKAKEMLLFLYDKKYKLDRVSFYLGEIEYKKGNYKLALSFYKKTIKINKNKTEFYMDDLLYHTGYSLEKLGQRQAAKKSYLKLIKDYSKSSFVKYAKKRLQNLEKMK